MSSAAAQAFKKEGNKLFQAGKHREAIAKYTLAIEQDGTDVTFFSNRSAAYAALELWEEAAEDGRACIRIKKDFIKGYFRLAVALRSLKRYKEAVDNIKMGLAVDPGNSDLKKQASEMEEIMRQDKVAGLISKAKEQAQNGDFGECLKTIDRGLALDGGNKELTSLKSKVKPKFEASEKRRVSGLSKPAREKEDGDVKYKNADFEGAIAAYTRCLDALPDKSTELALKALSNRAACYKQLSNFDGTIEDCTAVLEVEPDNVKSLVRRAQAFEAVERYKSALQDVKYVLSMPANTVGQANWTLCNQMQHRLNRVVQQLKQGM
ncbi:hypothetical protein CTAYLR_005059 [Chrysophaeum taylorii]|uniref:Uncharacterized protein n=1 Tax=Chrysophaeum taylorii TaxID=2483200 RepID=A0AAD7U9Z1_9STRA|nr:hypothetical protein CTAYLR_005059 [Chrysophaeum taylorii]